DAAALGAALASPEGQAVVADMPNFLDPSRSAFLVVEGEAVPLPPGPAGAPAAEASPETVPSRFSPSLGPLILAGTRHHHGRPQCLAGRFALPLDQGDGGCRGMPAEPRGKRQSQRSRPDWISSPAVAGPRAGL